jgi:hypothetical protein
MSCLGLTIDTPAQVTAREQNRFLECLAHSGKLVEAARWAKVARTWHYIWMERDPSYPPRVKLAMKRYFRLLEDEARLRATEGVRKPILYQGHQVHINGIPQWEYTKSDMLLIRLLEAGEPDTYKARSETTVKMPQSIEDLPEELLDSFIQRFEQLAAAKRARLQAAPAPASEQTVDVKPAEPRE